MIERNGYRFLTEEWAEAWMSLISKHRSYGNIRAGGSPAYKERAERDQLRRQNTALRQRLDQVAQGNEALGAIERENRKLRAELRKTRERIASTARALEALAKQTMTMGELVCIEPANSSPERRSSPFAPLPPTAAS